MRTYYVDYVVDGERKNCPTEAVDEDEAIFFVREMEEAHNRDFYIIDVT